MAFYEGIVDVSSGVDARRQVMDSWDAKTREMYEAFLAGALEDGCSQLHAEDFAYSMTVGTLGFVDADYRRQIMDSWDVDTMELYNVLRADAVASGCSEADGSSYAYDVLMSLL